MATAIIPKSEIRKVTSISHGYGEIPIVEKENEFIGWALPGQIITTSRAVAEETAIKLDQIIRSNITDKTNTKFLA